MDMEDMLEDLRDELRRERTLWRTLERMAITDPRRARAIALQWAVAERLDDHAPMMKAAWHTYPPSWYADHADRCTRDMRALASRR